MNTGKGAYLDSVDNLYFLSGKLEALDSPGEWYMDEDSKVLYVWMPDSAAPGDNVGVKVKNYCVNHDGGGGGTASFHLANLTLFGCTFKMTNCNDCTVDSVTTMFPTYQSTIPNMGVDTGPVPPQTLIEGNRNTVSRFHMRYSNNGGLKIVGSNNTISESLFEDLTWLGTLDFPPIELGFGSTQPTSSSSSTSAPASADVRTRTSSAANESERGRDSVSLQDTSHPPQLPLPPSALVHMDARGIGDQTEGNNNTVTRTTVRRCGEMGILTSQRSNTITYTHVYEIGLIGLDSAGLHADNTVVSCMDYSLPAGQRADCVKHWHHNWVHDCREKCVRGDDYNLNLTVDHSVIWNCGRPEDRNIQASTGAIIKGDYNRFYANTVFNVTQTPYVAGNQGDLCLPIQAYSPAATSGRYNITQQNANTIVLNSLVENVTAQRAPSLPPIDGSQYYKVFQGLHRDEASMMLANVDVFDFRPLKASPLVGKGVVFPPYVPARSDGATPDIGAYQHDDATPWQPGCTFTPSCTEMWNPPFL